MKKTILSTDDDATIVKDYIGGLTYKQITKKYKISNSRLCELLSKHHVTIRKNGEQTKTKLTKCNEDEIIKLYTEVGIGITEISKKYHITNKRTKEILSKHGISLRNILTTDEEKEIVNQYVNNKISQYELASKYHIGKKRLISVLKKHDVKIKTNGEQHKTFLTIDDERNLIFDYLSNGLTFEDVKTKYKLGQKRLQNIILKHKANIREYSTSKLEQRVRNILVNNDIGFVHQQTFPWLKSAKHWALRLDFYLPEHNIAIECQGRQHYQPSNTGFFTKEVVDEIRQRDTLKYNLCKEHGIENFYVKYNDNVEEMLNNILSKLNA